jgi:hypothetical protein
MASVMTNVVAVFAGQPVIAIKVAYLGKPTFRNLRHSILNKLGRLNDSTSWMMSISEIHNFALEYRLSPAQCTLDSGEKSDIRHTLSMSSGSALFIPRRAM